MKNEGSQSRTVAENSPPFFGVSDAQWSSLLLATAGLGTWYWNLHSDQQTLSPALLEFFQVEELNSAITLRWQDFLLAEERVNIQRELQDFIAQGKSEPFSTLCHVQVASSSVPVALHASLINDQATGEKSLFGYFRRQESKGSKLEIEALTTQLAQCQEKRAEERQSSQNQVSAIVQGMYDALITFNEFGEILTWNPAAERLFGLFAKDTLGKNVRQIMPSPLDTQVTKFYNDVVHDPTGSLFGAKIDVVATRGDRTKFQAELALSNYEVQGQFHYIATVRDVTLKKKAAEALRLGRREAEKANLAKSQFLANMSHELHTPLNAILGFNQALSDEIYGPLNDKQKHTMAVVQKSSQDLLKLIDNLLDLAKLEADRLPLHFSVCCIAATAKAILFSYRPQMTEKKIRCLFEASNHRPKVKVDLRRIEQILRVLIENAIKFTFEGGQIKLCIQTELERDRIPFDSLLQVKTRQFKRAKRRLKLSIEDNGVGISRSHQTRIFSKFHQVDSSHKRQKNGAGLGLTLAKNLIEAQKGKIRVESSQDGPDRGTRFILTFPEFIEER